MRTRRFRLVGAGITAALVAGTLGLAAQSAEAAAPLVADPTSLVDTFLGTGSGGANVGDVDMFPGASMPFGMVAWSPDTSPKRPASGGYAYDSGSTIGLTVTHVSGAGCNIEGNLPILPTTGAIPANPTNATEPFSHDDEKAAPGSYEMRLGADGEMSAKLAATTRTGIGDFGFPATNQANFLFKAGDSQNGDTAADVSIDGDHEVSGSITSGHFCGDQQLPEPVYYAVSFDRPFTSYGTWNSKGTNPGSRTDASGKGSGGWVTFDTTDAGHVGMKVGISYVSEAGAKANLAAENRGWSEQAVARSAHDTWRQLLSKIQVGGGTRDHQVQFYTALYHALLVPTTFSDANGQYQGFDLKTHTLPPGRTQYTNFSGWDIYRSEIPLLATLLPKQTSDMVQSLLNDAEQGGWLPKWPNGNTETGVMNGDAADPIIAEAYTFGARDFDTKAALKAMVKGATAVPTKDQLGQGWYEERPQSADYQKLGYVPNDSSTNNSAVTNGASETLEYALDDFSIAKFAQATGASSTYRTFLDRSQNWTKLFNTGSGYLQPRDGDGAFPTGDPVTAGMSSFGQSGFQEGNAAQYAWAVPQNLGGLVQAMGGDDNANRRLDAFFTSFNSGPNDPTYWAGNEIDLLAPWVYDYTGEPYKTQSTVHQLIDTVYSDTPGGEPGNDDLGAMSSWYVWSAMGMYPETPGTPVLALGTPLFPRVQLNLDGRQVTVSAPGTSADTYYVHGLSVNGQRTSDDWLPATDLLGRGRPLSLDYTVGSTPDTAWGARTADRPPSFPAGRATFPTGVTPVDMTTTPAAVTVPTGASADTTMALTVDAGSEITPSKPIRTLTWNANPPAGVTVTPATGTTTVGADGKAQVELSVSAAADAPQGFEAVPIALSSTDTKIPLPTLSFPVSVVGTGDTATACTTLGDTNTAQGLAQHEVGGDGSTTPQTVGGQSARTTVPLVTDDLNMYFQLDKRLAFGTTSSTTFTISYYDSGTDSWSLQYDAAGTSGAYTRALSVTNTNTDTWKTATVTVPDSYFANRENGSSDFRIASGSPVTVHSVRTETSGPGVLPMNLCPAP
ncbi:GH92 family glycosyl hydrolase [Actinacidiphila yeochonensis]|uniref:GH92 family glycosyl hydrolase n=1 Tax=Actinacidiphila yeochonensis TaxID=89050 RepID=UPI000691417E|nr:GH92 family glycosyl hydrolase [Actinacidiphila yeochonensis]